MNRISRLLLVGTFALLAAAALLQAPPEAAASAVLFQDTDVGAQVYAAECAACHQANGEGISGTFPPLAGNPAAADEAYVASVVRDGLTGSIEVLGVTYSTAMPAVDLSDEDVSAVAAYVATLAGSGSDTTTTTPPVAAPYEGDADRGHDLFVGSASFANGGPACAACHVAGSVDGWGGTALGPDLTSSFDELGEEAGLTGWLANPPSPVMAPLFADNSLNDDEIADVIAFLDGAKDTTPGSNVDYMAVFGLAGALILFGGLAIGARGLRRTYTERLRSTQ